MMSYVRLLLLTAVPLIVTFDACDSRADEWHIERLPVRRIKATLTYDIQAPNIIANDWLAFAAHPVDMPSQTNVMATISPWGSLTQEKSPLRRPTLVAKIPVDKEPSASPTTVTIHVDYRATLFSRHLRAGKSTSTVTLLGDTERALYLRTSPSCDFDEGSFQSWLTDMSLRRTKYESTVPFARRAAEATRETLVYRKPTAFDYRASRVCSDGSSTCGGISNLYTSILRANGIPARNLAGRLAKSADGVSGSCHNRVEFFANGVGWIPVEITSAVSFKDSPLDNHFGVDRGDMLYFHADTDFVFDTENVAGRKRVPFAQWIHYWANGRGSWKERQVRVTWRVEELSLQIGKR